MRKVKESVDYETASARIAIALSKSNHRPLSASELAWHVWPGHTMRPQGAALAIGKTLRKMEREGLIRYYIASEFTRGYVVR